MSESKKQFEQKEQLKRVVRLEWGLGDRGDHLLRIPDDWDVGKMKERFFESHEGGFVGAWASEFISWLLENGAQEFVTEEVYLGET